MDERGNMVYHPQQQLLYAGLKKEEAGRLACLGDGTYVEDTVIYSVQRVPGSTWRVVGVSYIDETVNESFRHHGYHGGACFSGRAGGGLGAVPPAVPPVAAARNSHGAV